MLDWLKSKNVDLNKWFDNLDKKNKFFVYCGLIGICLVGSVLGSFLYWSGVSAVCALIVGRAYYLFEG